MICRTIHEPQIQQKSYKGKKYYTFTILRTPKISGSQLLIFWDPQKTLTNNAYAIKYLTIGLDDSKWVDTRLLRNLYCRDHKFKDCCLRYESLKVIFWNIFCHKVTVNENKSNSRRRDIKQTNNVAELMMQYVDQASHSQSNFLHL